MQHVKYMRLIAEKMRDTPLVLKGGTALMLAYGSERYSVDLDFDSPKKMNLQRRIEDAMPHGTVRNIHVRKDTETVTRYRMNYAGKESDSTLKIEISHRDAPD